MWTTDVHVCGFFEVCRFTVFEGLQSVRPHPQILVEGDGFAIVERDTVSPARFLTDVPCFGVVEVFGQTAQLGRGLIPLCHLVPTVAMPISVFKIDLSSIEKSVLDQLVSITIGDGAVEPQFLQDTLLLSEIIHVDKSFCYFLQSLIILMILFTISLMSFGSTSFAKCSFIFIFDSYV